MLYVGFCTPHYEEEAAGWLESAKEFGLETMLHRVECQGNWCRNAQMKAEVILCSPKPCVYVDVDARFRAYPELFDSVEGVFGAHWTMRMMKNRRRGPKVNFRELLSGTLYFGEGSESLIHAWMDKNDQNQGRWDQMNLQDVIETCQWPHFELPAPYCLIFDRMKHLGPPVIEHFQASRRFRHTIGQ